jgi:hypothetical protein
MTTARSRFFLSPDLDAGRMNINYNKMVMKFGKIFNKKNKMNLEKHGFYNKK